MNVILCLFPKNVQSEIERFVIVINSEHSCSLEEYSKVFYAINNVNIQNLIKTKQINYRKIDCDNYADDKILDNLETLRLQYIAKYYFDEEFLDNAKKIERNIFNG